MLDCLRFNAKTHISLMRHHSYTAGGSGTDTGLELRSKKEWAGQITDGKRERDSFAGMVTEA